MHLSQRRLHANRLWPTDTHSPSLLLPWLPARQATGMAAFQVQQIAAALLGFLCYKAALASARCAVLQLLPCACCLGPLRCTRPRPPHPAHPPLRLTLNRCCRWAWL